MHRRSFLQATAGGAAAATRLAATAGPGPARDPRRRIDTHVSLFPWPGRRLPDDEPAALAARLIRNGITEAWAGSFEGILHRDLAGVNARLAEACAASGGLLRPFGSVNLALPAWEDDVRRCHEIHRMPGLRLHPNYHGYDLADPRFRRLLALATARGLLVQIVCLVEDTRTQNALLRVPDVDLAPLEASLATAPGARVLLLNSGKVVGTPAFDRLARRPGVFADTARIESVGGVGRAFHRLPPGRLVFGSHAPFFIHESAVLKVFEGGLTAGEIEALVDANPRALLAG